MEDNDEEFEMEPFFIPDIYFLGESKSAEEFYQRLGEMIFDVPKYNEQELKYLSELVSKPWKRKKGRPFDEERASDILYTYRDLVMMGKKPKKMKDFIQLISKKYKLEYDAARKAVGKALSPMRGSTEADDIPF